MFARKPSPVGVEAVDMLHQSRKENIVMGGLFIHEFVTGPVSSTGVSMVVSLANTTPNDTLAAVLAMPNAVGDGELAVPAQSVVTVELDLGPGKGPPFQGWLSIQIQSDLVVPTATIVSDAGTQVYLPGDFVVFDIPTGTRLW
jgi:hypothetical protein